MLKIFLSLVAIVGLGLLMVSINHYYGDGAVAIQYENPNPRSSKASFLKQVNEERAKLGVGPLQAHPDIERAAQIKADDMLARNYTGHMLPGTDSFYNNEMSSLYQKVECIYISENLVDADNARIAIGSWKSSPAHYKAMTDPAYTYTGFGIAGGKTVEHFCTVK